MRAHLGYAERIEQEVARSTPSAVVLLELLVQEAVQQQASDIHIDPFPEIVRVRLRIHGVLYDAHKLPTRVHAELLARLKIVAGLRTDEHYVPQDGRFRHTLADNSSVDVRISIAPTYYGENAVLRLLLSRPELQTLTSLGMSTEQQASIMEVLMQPNGLILVTGPTGSGKTSTLYSLLQLRNTSETSLITIEDPIEYSMPGIRQIPANAQTGLGFAEGLRSILRQDPNIIGVGEIRDGETASLAIHAALTGHLVLSTLHTTDAPTVFPRLSDLGIEPYLLASTIRIIIAQRLVRKLCGVCSRTELLTELELQQCRLRDPLHLVPPQSTQTPSGCVECFYSGYTGRIGVFQVLVLSDALKEAVTARTSLQKLYALSFEAGMSALFTDALEKVRAGTISITDALLHCL